ncbi:MAG: solute carrier family 23 protein, partial [Veillonella parvula]|nr:solute carrier family 23 protein [Veillonella parvula]
FMNGIGTLLYLFVCKGKIPAYLGSSFAFIAPVAGVLSAGLGYEAAKGAFVVFGLSFVILSILVRYIGTRWIDKLFPPAAMGAIVAIIGLELAPVAMSMSGLIGNQDLGMSHSQAIILSAFMGVVDFSGVEAAPWFSLPQFYGMPVFDINAIIMIMPALFVVFAEHVGHLVVTSNIVSKDLMKEPGLQRSLLGDGLANILSGFFGATPNTTYGENIGVLAITRCFSVWVIGGAAVLAMIISFVGKVAALIHAIPVPVMGGVSILLFGIIAASGLRMLVERKVDYTNPVNMILTSVILVVGLSGAELAVGPVVLKGMGLATVVGMAMSICLLILQKTGVGNDQLKKTEV